MMVSVILPNYCHARFLEQRIESILNQTYQDFELIILDDCSDDNGASVDVIEKYRDNPHVTHIEYNAQNSGSTFKQWQKGFELAKGEYVWIAESDDYCTNDHLERLLEEVEKNENVSVAFCQSQYVDAEGQLMEPIFSQDDDVEVFEGIDFIRRHMYYGCAIWNSSSAIFKREFALSVNAQYQSYVSAGDRLFWIEMAEKGKVVSLHCPRNFFRQHQNKVTPVNQRRGVTSLEDLKVVKYLESQSYCSFLDGLYMRITYLKGIEKAEYENEEIRCMLQKAWRKYGVLTPGLMQLLANIMIKLSK